MSVVFGLILASVSLFVGGELAWAVPPASNSWYINTTDTAVAYDKGCSLGQLVYNTPGTQSPVVFLHFGSPRLLAGNVYGTSFYQPPGQGYNTLVTASMALEFAHGYWQCAYTDTSSYLKLSIGTSNDGNPAIYPTHGQTWASTVISTQQALNNQGATHWQTFAYGGTDLEPPSGGSFNTFATTKPWLDAYNAVSGRPSLYANAACFGVTSGPYTAGTSCGTGWTADNMWYGTWGLSAARPLPQIYATNAANAAQWQLLSKYAKTAHGSKMSFVGAMSQSLACSQVACPPGTNNTPTAAWNQLQFAVNTDAATAMTIPAVTDIGKT